MSWECAECNTREGRKDRNTRIDAVCHHCGKPLCRGDRVEIADYAFAGAAGKLGQVAVHCWPCKRKYHQADLVLGGDSR
jgi:hypothetical protein